MASTLRGRRLTETHRLAQTRLGVQTVSQMVPLWRLLDPSDIDNTLTGWLRAVVPVVQRQNLASAQLAANYYRLFRAAEVGTPLETSVEMSADAERIIASMSSTGPARLKAATGRGVALEEAAETAFSTSASAAQRLTLDGGRSTLIEAVRTDDAALGYQRVASGDPCHFCLMLLSRGPVYGSEATAGFEAHDRCSCTAEPVFDRNTAPAPGAEAALARWREATDGLSGSEAMNAFRVSLAESPLSL